MLLWYIGWLMPIFSFACVMPMLVKLSYILPSPLAFPCYKEELVGGRGSIGIEYGVDVAYSPMIKSRLAATDA